MNKTEKLMVVRNKLTNEYWSIFGWNDVKWNATLFRENDTKFLSLPCKNSEYIEDTIFKKVD